MEVVGKSLVARVKAEAVEELCEILDTKEGQKDIYRLAADSKAYRTNTYNQGCNGGSIDER